MMKVRDSNRLTLTGWPAVGIFMTMALTKVLTALVMSFPLAWLVSHIATGGLLRFVFGADGLSYWRCVGLFAIWHTGRVRIKFSGPSHIKIEGDR